MNTIHENSDEPRCDNWQQYAKDGETAQDVIERWRKDTDALLSLMVKDRTAIQVLREALVRCQSSLFIIYRQQGMTEDEARSMYEVKLAMDALAAPSAPAQSEVAEPVAKGDPLQFVCQGGCGACGVKLRDFVTHATQAQEGDLWVTVAHEPQVVSACCGSPVEVWDERTNDVAALVLAATPPQPSPVADEREAFEAWWEKQDHLTLKEQDWYKPGAWMGWQARAALASQPAASAGAGEPVASMEVQCDGGEISLSFAPEPAGLDLPAGDYKLYTASPNQPAVAQVPDEFVQKVQAAGRAEHPVAKATLIDEALELLAAAPEAPAQASQPAQAEAVEREALISSVRQALDQAFAMGQRYWADADSENYSANKRSDATRQKFNAMRDGVVAALSAKTAESVRDKRRKEPECKHEHIIRANDIAWCDDCGTITWASDGLSKPGWQEADEKRQADWCSKRVVAWGCNAESRGEPRCEQWCQGPCPVNLRPRAAATTQPAASAGVGEREFIREFLDHVDRGLIVNNHGGRDFDFISQLEAKAHALSTQHKEQG